MTDDGGSPPPPPPPPPPTPPPPPRDKGKAKVGEPAEIASDDDQSGRDPLDPGSRNKPADDRETAAIVRVPINLKPRPKVMPLKGTCLTLKLSPIEVLEPHPKLNLSSDEASLLTESNEILRDPPIRFSRDLIVFDASDRRYDMNISNHESGSLSRFHVNTEWHEFVRARKVRERSEVWFYRLLDDVSGRLYYRIEVFQIPESRPPTSGYHQIRKNVPRHVESSDPTEDEKNCCLSRALTLHEVDSANPVLYIYPEEAYDLTGCKDLLRTPSASFSKTLHVNDDFDRTYNLRLSPYFVSKDWAGYSISGDWRDFVRANSLEACDQILFYNHSLGSTSDKDCYYYDLKIIRKEPELAVVKVDNKEKSFDPNVHLRVLSAYSTLCFTKTLSKYEGVHDGGKPRLFLDADDAGRLLECTDICTKYPVGELRENLMVFDADKKQYDMLLSNFETPLGDVLYAVDDGWQIFVESHNLTAGDSIVFYRSIIKNMENKTFYLVRYIKKNSPPMSGVGPSGSGQKEEEA